MTSTRVAKKTAANKPAAKPKDTTPAKPPRTRRTAKNTAPKAKLPTRPTPTNTPWMTDIQGYATCAARITGITTPHIRDWTDQGDNTASRSHHDGQLLYEHRTRTLTWIAACPQGIQHAYTLYAPGDFEAAELHLGACTDRHTPVGPEVRSLNAAFNPPTTVRALGDDLTKSTSSTAATQPMSLDQIDAGLHARATDDQPKEHPEP